MANTQVTGTDGVVVVQDPDSRWTIWALQQLYMGGPGQNRYVGRVNDYVIDYTTDERWKIVAVDETTLIPTLKDIVPVINPGDIDLTDLLYGVGPGTQSDTYRVYIDQSVVPYKLATDKRLTINGVKVKYGKIFKGSKLDGTAKVISRVYDASGNFLGENIPLELVEVPNGQNYAVKTPASCYTLEALADGEVVTFVGYEDDGGVVSTRQLLAQNSSAIRATDTQTKYIVGITLESPWITSSNPNLLAYPINVPVNSMNLFGVVHYSDGSTLRQPVDGTKFQLFNFKDYVATVVGQSFDITLKYNLAKDEIVYNASGIPTGDKFIEENYTATTMNADGAYTLKLFVAPVFNATLNQYRLDWYLYNLDRNIAQLVTPYVVFGDNHVPFDGTPSAYGTNQNLQVTLDLNKVNGLWRKVLFTQTLSIATFRGGTDHSGTNWTISYDPGQNPPYGTGIVAKMKLVEQNLKYMDITQGATDFNTFIARVLAPAKPLYDTRQESTYPSPNMFSFLYSDGTEDFFTIDQWNAQNLTQKIFNDGDTLLVKFINRTQSNDIQIAICPMVVQSI